jgi:ribonuclease VapC
MVLDTSSIVAILLGEDEEELFLHKMSLAPRLLLSACTLYELGVVLMNHETGDAEHLLDPFLQRAGIEIVPFDTIQAAIARQAYRAYGRGRHRAKLNLGDCFAYALATRTGDALLFKGNDFGYTDVLVA